MDKNYTTRELCEIVGITIGTLKSWVKELRLRPGRGNGELKFSAHQVETMVMLRKFREGGFSVKGAVWAIRQWRDHGPAADIPVTFETEWRATMATMRKDDNG